MNRHSISNTLGAGFVLLIVALWILAATVVPAAIIKFCWLYLMGV